MCLNEQVQCTSSCVGSQPSTAWLFCRSATLPPLLPVTTATLLPSTTSLHPDTLLVVTLHSKAGVEGEQCQVSGPCAPVDSKAVQCLWHPTVLMPLVPCLLFTGLCPILHPPASPSPSLKGCSPSIHPTLSVPRDRGTCEILGGLL